jgi:predicted transcriptional regulator
MPDGRYRPHYALTLRLKPSIGRMLEETANKMGMSKTAVLTIALRELAKKEGVQVEEENDDGD